MPCGWVKLKLKQLVIMKSVVFEGKMWRLQYLSASEKHKSWSSRDSAGIECPTLC